MMKKFLTNIVTKISKSVKNNIEQQSSKTNKYVNTSYDKVNALKNQQYLQM